MGFWYTIEIAFFLSSRIAAFDMAPTSAPSNMTRPAVIDPLRGRYRIAEKAAVDLPHPDSPTKPYASPGAIDSDTPLRTRRLIPRIL